MPSSSKPSRSPASVDSADIPSTVMTVREVAAYLHVHVGTIYRMIKDKQIPAFKLGGGWRFNVESIDRWRLAQDSGHGIDLTDAETTGSANR